MPELAQLDQGDQATSAEVVLYVLGKAARTNNVHRRDLFRLMRNATNYLAGQGIVLSLEFKGGSEYIASTDVASAVTLFVASHRVQETEGSILYHLTEDGQADANEVGTRIPYRDLLDQFLADALAE